MQCIALTRAGFRCRRDAIVFKRCPVHIGSNFCSKCNRTLFKDELHHKYCYVCGAKITQK